MVKKKPAKKTRTIDQRFTTVERLLRTGFQRTDARFQQIDRGLARNDRRIEQIDRRLARNDRRIEQIDRRLAQIYRRFEQIDGRFVQIDRRFDVVDLNFRVLRKEMNERFAGVEDRIDRLATHVDGFMKLHETLDPST